VRIENGQILKQVDGTVYSTIDDYFAKRDYETNGDYVVNDFTITPSANTVGDDTLYDLNISKGIAYVQGYRVENQSNLKLTNNRAQTTSNIASNQVSINYGNYYIVDTANGVFDIGTLPEVDLHLVGTENIVTTNTRTYTATLAGKAFLRNMSYLTGTGSNTKSYAFNAYVSDLSFNTLSGNVTSGTATTVTINDTNGSFSAVANAYIGCFLTVTTNTIKDTRKIVSYNGTTKVMTVDNPFTINPTSASKFTLTFQNYDVESIVKVNAGGTSTPYGIVANTNVSLFGKTNGIVSGDSILYNQGMLELIFPVGYPYVQQISTSSYVSQRIYHSKTLTSAYQLFATAADGDNNPLRFLANAGTLTGSQVPSVFTIIDNSTGQILDFSQGSTSGNYIVVDNSKTFATIYCSGGYIGKNVTILASVSVSNANLPNYALKIKNLINGDYTISSSLSTVSSNTSHDLTKGQVYISKSGISSSKMSLYVNDVKKIVKIIDSGSPATSFTGGSSSNNYTDITNYFTLDNGQRDTIYDHASIQLLPGAPLPVGNILVILDYYSHGTAGTSGGDGYFSVQSYSSTSSNYGGGSGISASPEEYPEIGSYTAKDGTTYRLADCVDFRPCRSNGQTGYVWEYSRVRDNTNDVGVLLPANLTTFNNQYYYFLGRNDKLVLSKDKTFQIIQGTPSVTPISPSEPFGSLLIANLYHDPYTAFVPGEGTPGIKPNLSVKKVIHKRWAKKDISDLEQRINNLEYYTSLSILEQNAQSLQIADVNGLNRFKNGILVDDFSSFATADTANPDYAANINIRQNRMSALQIVNNFQLQNPVVLAGLGTYGNTNTYTINSIQGTQTNIFTLPYTKANVIVQPLASSVVSANPFQVVVQEGVAKLNPPMDNWVDNNEAPAILITDPGMTVYQATGGVNLLNSGDMQTIPGTSTTTVTQTVTGRTLATTTNTYASQLQNTVSSAYNPVSSTFGQNNGYLTSVAVLPYIRPQQIIIEARGLLVNTPVSTYFDGQNVASFMTTPNTIEVTNVASASNRGFKSGDIVGFYITGNSTFYPVARVINVYRYSNTACRLYVGEITGAPGTIGTTTIQNALFDNSGNYIPNSATATGTISAAAMITLGQSGDISGVGGSYANTISGSSVAANFYAAPIVQGYSDFLNLNGIWGDPNNSTGYQAAFILPGLTTGQQYIVEAACSGSVTVRQNTSTILTVSSGTTAPSSATFTAQNSTILLGWVATSSGTTTSSVAVVVKDLQGNVKFSSLHPPSLAFTNAGTQTIMPGGGAWFAGATQIQLDPGTASSVANFYVGSRITVTSKYVYQLDVSATYVPPPPAPSGGGGGCCVVATALTSQGNWSEDQYKNINSWATKVLDRNWFGDRLHRGYHIIAPKVAIPLLKTRAKKYVDWSFTNATNMLMGKKFDLMSIPNSVFWITLMGVTGLFVSKEQAEKSWNNLYK
jgi:hypothetical protein